MEVMVLTDIVVLLSLFPDADEPYSLRRVDPICHIFVHTSHVSKIKKCNYKNGVLAIQNLTLQCGSMAFRVKCCEVCAWVSLDFSIFLASVEGCIKGCRLHADVSYVLAKIQ